MVRLGDRFDYRRIYIFPLRLILSMSRYGCFSLTTLLLTSIFTASLLLACSNGKPWNPDDYTVKSGDTLYSIAWRYELDPEEFAAWNGISTSRFIKAGQRMHTRKPANFDANNKKRHEQSIAYVPISSDDQTYKSYPKQKWVKAEKGDTLYSLSRRYDISIERLAQLNQLKKPYLIQPGQTIFLKPLDSSRSASANAGKGRSTNQAGSNTTSSQATTSTALRSADSLVTPSSLFASRKTGVRYFSAKLNAM